MKIWKYLKQNPNLLNIYKNNNKKDNTIRTYNTVI